MPQIRLTLLKGAEVISTSSSTSQFIDVDDLAAAHERTRVFVENFHSQGVVIEADIPPTVLTVRMTGIPDVVDPDGMFWEDLRSVVAGRPLVL